MRGDIHELRAIRNLTRGIEAGPGCRICGRQDIGADAELCGRCRRELRPTPLDQVLGATGMTAEEFAAAHEIPERTVLRAVKGIRVSRRVALRLARATGFPAEAFREEAEG